MMRRDARSADELSQLRSEIRQCPDHAESQSDKFQNILAELRIQMERPDLRMPVFHQRLLIYKLEKLNYPPGSRL